MNGSTGPEDDPLITTEEAGEERLVGGDLDAEEVSDDVVGGDKWFK